MEKQESLLAQIISPPDCKHEGQDSCDPSGIELDDDTSSVLVYDTESDSASQRIRALVSKKLSAIGVKSPHGHFIQHILNQRGCMMVSTYARDGASTTKSSCQVLIPAAIMEDQGTNSWLEVFFQGLSNPS